MRETARHTDDATSNIFILFMAAVLPLYALATYWRPNSGKHILIALSLFFYSYWLPIYLVLILGSIAVNFSIGYWGITARDGARRRLITGLGIAARITRDYCRV